MKRWCGALLLLAVCAVPAQTHFVWIVPLEGPEGTGAQVIFSDDLQPDPNVPITKIAATELVSVGDGKEVTRLKLTPVKGKNALVAVPPGKGAHVLVGSCLYGVVQRGKSDPYLMVYLPKALIGATPQRSPAAFWKPSGRVHLEVVLVEGKSKARVLWQGKPLAGAEVAVRAPGQDEATESKTDAEGFVALGEPKGSGLYAIRARHVVTKEGEHAGKKYREVRYYATLTFPVGRVARGAAPAAGAAQPAVKADPVATKLLREARAARANWNDFPGFTAALEVNHGGKVVKGKVEVAATGNVKVDLPDPTLRSWTHRQLQSAVDHRLDNSAERDTPCAFVDDNANHPLGRAIRVLNDELHSGYRIRDRQIIEVNRQMKDARFTITVLENRLNREKKFVPVSYVVNTWDLKTGALRSSAAFHHTWQRVGAYDLPQTTLVVTATGLPQLSSPTPGAAPTSFDARTITLSGFKLLR